MTRNNNLSVIPFYEAKEEQDFRKWWAYSDKYPHFVSGKWLVPFFFSLPLSQDRTISKVEFFKVCCKESAVYGNGSFDLSFDDSFEVWGEDDSYEDSILANGLSVYHDGYDMVVYPATQTNALNLPKGIYYIAITFSDQIVRYSDLFFVATDEELNRMTKVEWYCGSNLEYEGGYIPYGLVNTFKNTLYLSTDIGYPTYEFTDEGEERNGFFFPLKQLSTKTFKFNIIAPEYLCDAMRTIHLSDRVKVTDPLGREYQCDTFLMDVEWQEQGHYASVGCEFTTDTVVRRIPSVNTITTR